MFSRGRPFVERKMGIFDCRHLDIGILVNHSGTDVVTEEEFLNRDRAASVGNSDLGADGEILYRSLDQVLCPGWTIDVDRLGPLIVPCGGH